MLAAVIAAATGDGIGASDCELLRDEALAQPVNALTSLAYVVTGAVVIATARRRHRPLIPAAIFGSCLMAIGVGSVLFHGPQPAGSRVLHDLPIIVTVLFVLSSTISTLSRPGRVRPWPTFAAGVAAATVPTAVAPAVATMLTGVGVAVIVTLEVVVACRRRGRCRDRPPCRPPSLDHPRARRRGGGDVSARAQRRPRVRPGTRSSSSTASGTCSPPASSPCGGSPRSRRRRAPRP